MGELVFLPAATSARAPGLWTFALFVLVWCWCCCALSIVGGWHALARRYRARGLLEGATFWFVLMVLGRGIRSAGYGGIVFVHLGDKGIALVVCPLFRLLHPPLLIPWGAVTRCCREKIWFREYTAVYLSRPDTRMAFAGRAGWAIYEMWETRSTSEATVA